MDGFSKICENGEEYFQNQCKIQLGSLRESKTEFLEKFEHCGDIKGHADTFQEEIDTTNFYCSLEFGMIDCKISFY